MGSLRLEPVDESPAVARAYVRDLLMQHGWAAELVAEAELLTSEVVTNAVVHAATPIDVTASVTEAEMTVEVTDRGPGAVAIPSTRRDGAGGQGLSFLDQIASHWEVEPLARGKTVRFSLVSGVGRSVSSVASPAEGEGTGSALAGWC